MISQHNSMKPWPELLLISVYDAFWHQLSSVNYEMSIDFPCLSPDISSICTNDQGIQYASFGNNDQSGGYLGSSIGTLGVAFRKDNIALCGWPKRPVSYYTEDKNFLFKM